MNTEEKKVTENELEAVSGGQRGYDDPIVIGLKVLQNTFPSDYKGSDLGYVSEILGDDQYRVMWDNGYDGDIYDEHTIRSMHMQWDIMYGY